MSWHNYLFVRDKRKEHAPNYAAYYPFGVDVFLSQRKISHVARFVELPVISSSGELPPILVVNVQVLPPFYFSFCLHYNFFGYFLPFFLVTRYSCYSYFLSTLTHILFGVFNRFHCTLPLFSRVKLMGKESILFCTLNFLKATQRNFHPISKKA